MTMQYKNQKLSRCNAKLLATNKEYNEKQNLPKTYEVNLIASPGITIVWFVPYPWRQFCE